MNQERTPLTAQQIEEWIVEFLRNEYGLRDSDIDLDCPLADLGLDSLETVMVVSLEKLIGLELNDAVVFDHPTIRKLAGYVADTCANPRQMTGTTERLKLPPASDYERYVNPYVGRTLRALSLDKEFVRGSGSMLYDSEGRAYLDCVASYGAVPFGHDDSLIWDAIARVRNDHEPVFVQPSRLHAAAQFAKRLAELVFDGDGIVTFTNSGTEAIEVAIKLCRARTARPGFLATEGGFHGKTLGALSATGSSVHKRAFGPLGQEFQHVPFGDSFALERALRAQPDFFAGFIVEPIQGEGGIVEAPPEYLLKARELCSAYGVLMVCDEVQTGLGRTGTMLAMENEGAVPDIVTLAKALGGGVVPVGACIARTTAHSSRFAAAHSSTFAGNSLAARVGVAVLDRLESENRALLRSVRDNGRWTFAELEQLREEYPEVISDVRGRGYMLGLRLGGGLECWSNSLLAIAAGAGYLCALTSSYLLNAHGVRVAPTLTAGDVLRIEPPLIATRSECQQLVRAVRQTVATLATGDAGAILRGIIHGAPQEAWKHGPHRADRVSRRAGEPCFGFISHPLDLESYGNLDPSLRRLSTEEKQRAGEILQSMDEPLVVQRLRIESSAGATAFGVLISVNCTATELRELPSDEREAKIRAAIRLARDLGATRVGLGAYTSVVTAGGGTVLDEDVFITSGNSYTCVAAVDAIDLAARRQNIDLRSATVALVGGGGAIGRALALLLSECVGRLVLVGNPNSERKGRGRLLKVGAEVLKFLAGRSDGSGSLGNLARATASAEDLPEATASLGAFQRFLLDMPGRVPVQTTGDALPHLREAHVVVTATSAPELSFGSDVFRSGAVVCDVSRPRNVGPEVATERPDLLVIEGGLVGVPGGIDVGLGLPKGRAYACMAETMMLALDNRKGHVSIGRNLELGPILELRASAKRHGFGITDVLERPV